jgi:deoxyribodipyrimidine photolyase
MNGACYMVDKKDLRIQDNQALAAALQCGEAKK